MRKSLKRAKQDALAVWRYLAEHGKIGNKQDLPPNIFRRIKNDLHICPLCEVLEEDCYSHPSYGRCPLALEGVGMCCSEGNPYDEWLSASSAQARARYAGEIVKLIEAWEV